MRGNGESTNLTLYHMEYCPYCVYVRDAMRRIGIALPLRDTLADPHARRELIAGGGKSQVPCLRIDDNGRTRWMYESDDIVRYLNECFG